MKLAPIAPTAAEMPFSISMAKAAKFETGLRSFLEYRDLGVKDATHGQIKAHVIRVKKGADHGDLHTTGLHQHQLNFQMIYILKGWIKFIYAGHGEHIFGPGDCCVQPPGIVHNELDCSDDLELLEITSPGDFVTTAVKP